MIKKAFLITAFVGASTVIYTHPGKPDANDPNIAVLEMGAQGTLIIKSSYEPGALPVDSRLEETLWRLGKVFACVKASRADASTFNKMGCQQIIKDAQQKND